MEIDKSEIKMNPEEPMEIKLFPARTQILLWTNRSRVKLVPRFRYRLFGSQTFLHVVNVPWHAVFALKHANFT